MCHGIINPLGFTLEHFDAVGRYRERDNGKPIDSSGRITPAGPQRDGQQRPRAGGVSGRKRRSPDRHLSTSCSITWCSSRCKPMGRKRRIAPRSFADNGFDIRKLAIEIMAESALTNLCSPPSRSCLAASLSSPLW